LADLSLASQTMFAELLQRCLDAEFDALYNERGRFVRVRSRGRLYWHFRSTVAGEKRQIYVGPVTDASITDRVTRFAEIKSDFKERRELVRALIEPPRVCRRPICLSHAAMAGSSICA